MRRAIAMAVQDLTESLDALSTDTWAVADHVTSMADRIQCPDLPLDVLRLHCDVQSASAALARIHDLLDGWSVADPEPLPDNVTDISERLTPGGGRR